MTLLELAERCEKAAGPDFAIDHAIEALVFDNHQGLMRSFTASLDAAMQLVPDGWDWIVFERGIPDPGFGCFLDAIDTWAATPALALCGAALRAREASSKAREQGN